MGIHVGGEAHALKKAEQTREAQDKKQVDFAQSVSKSTDSGGANDGKAKPKQTRKERRAGQERKQANKSAAGDDYDNMQISQMSELEEKTRADVDQERDKQEDLLNIVNAELQKTMEIAQDINVLLKKQSQYIRTLDHMLDKINEKVEGGIGSLDRIVDSGNGTINTWCPRIICLILVLLIAGWAIYLITGFGKKK